MTLYVLYNYYMCSSETTSNPQRYLTRLRVRFTACGVV